ncbi:MAG: crossover junction endodeoxyribonuclease RuvC [Candidatus Omnitrophota bacterium]
MRILGVDPGLGATGYGIIESGRERIKIVEAGVIRTSGKSSLQERLQILREALNGLIEECAPEVMVLEKLYSHYKHPTTAILMGHARGVICSLCEPHNLQLVNYAATRVKKTVTGNGRASKLQVQRSVQRILRLDEMPESTDLSDALALALSHVYIEKKSCLFK